MQTSVSKIVRWIIFIPVAVVVAFLISGLILGIGNWLVGSWKVLSALVFLLAGINLSSRFIMTGLSIAPVKNRIVRWTLIAIPLLFSLGNLAILVFVMLGPGIEQFNAASQKDSMSPSLSMFSQLVISEIGTLGATIYMAIFSVFVLGNGGGRSSSDIARAALTKSMIATGLADGKLNELEIKKIQEILLETVENTLDAEGS